MWDVEDYQNFSWKSSFHTPSESSWQFTGSTNAYVRHKDIIKNKQIYTITNDKNEKLFKVTDEIFELNV